MKSLAHQVAKLLLEIKAVTFRFNPPYTFTSGLKSPIYLDNRLVMSYPAVRQKIINYYLLVIKEKIGLDSFNWISATASAAIPQASLVAAYLKLPMVYVRPTTKQYGKGNQIEGYLPKGSRVLIIEDHISTGSSVVENARAIRQAGGKVRFCVASTTYETAVSQKNLKQNKIKLFSLTTGKVIVETALTNGYLTKKEKELVDLWFDNPAGWSSKVGL